MTDEQRIDLEAKAAHKYLYAIKAANISKERVKRIIDGLTEVVFAHSAGMLIAKDGCLYKSHKGEIGRVVFNASDLASAVQEQEDAQNTLNATEHECTNLG